MGLKAFSLFLLMWFSHVSISFHPSESSTFVFISASSSIYLHLVILRTLRFVLLLRGFCFDPIMIV